MSEHRRAVAQALFVTFLWSTSWVLIKFGLEEIPALSFAGLRYVLAFLILAPWIVRRGHLPSIARLSRGQWMSLIGLGCLMYTLTQGAQFLALERLPAQTTSLILSFSPVAVAFLGAWLLREPPTGRQFFGVGLFVVGAVTFLTPIAFPAAQWVGLGIAGAGLVANAGAAVWGRHVNRGADIPPLVVTFLSMGVGSVALLALGVGTQGWPELSWHAWAIVGWLAAVNTAFAFTLWNATLQRLSAVESSVVNNTMLIQIAVLAWIFLGESLGVKEIVGLTLAALGTLVVQLAARRPDRPTL